jgi:hypothetical protein
MFDTQYSPHNRISANPGSPVKVLYAGKYDANGRVVLEKKGEENLYDYIQSFRDSVDLNVILARFTNGDAEALNKAQGFYADVTDFPKNMADALNRINQAEEMFKALPLEIRQKFDCSFEQFLAQSGTEDWLSKMGFETSAPVESEIPPVQVEPPVVKEIKGDQE